MAWQRKIREKMKTPQGEAAFSFLFIVVLFIILPMLPLGKSGGGVAMLVCSILGLAVYAVFYRERLRAMKWVLVITAVVAALIAVIVGALSHGR